MSCRTASLLLALALPLAAGCSDKGADEDGDDTGSADDDTTDPLGVVWDELRIESSVTLTGAFPSGAGFYATGDDGEVYLRAEGEWAPMGLDLGEGLNGIWGENSGGVLRMVAVGDGGTVVRYADGWTVDATLGTANMEAVAGTSVDDLVAVGWGGAYAWTGAGWEFLPITGNPRFNDVWSDGVNAVAVGEEGVIAVRTSEGWTAEAPAGIVNLTAVSGTSASDIWAVGDAGTVLHYDGTAWTEVESPAQATLWGVVALGADQTYIVGNNGFAARWDGTGWTELPTGVDNNLYDVSVSPDGVIWACGNRGMALRLQGGN